MREFVGLAQRHPHRIPNDGRDETDEFRMLKTSDRKDRSAAYEELRVAEFVPKFLERDEARGGGGGDAYSLQNRGIVARRDSLSEAAKAQAPPEIPGIPQLHSSA